MSIPKLNKNDDDSWSISADSELEALAFITGLNMTIEASTATPEDIAAWVAEQKAKESDEA
jgi:hypothetical protein